MNWSEAESYVRGLGYTDVGPLCKAAQCDEGANSLLAEAEKCRADGDCPGPRPRIIFEYARPHDGAAPACVSLMQGGALDWRRAITEYTGADASHLASPMAAFGHMTVFKVKTTAGLLKVEVEVAPRNDVVVETIVEMGSGCED